MYMFKYAKGKKQAKARTITLLLSITAVIFISVASFVLSSCSPYVGSDKLKIVTTIFPPYDWVRVIAGDDADIELTLLLDSRVDLHSYQPTAADIIATWECDLFIYVGGTSDAWVEDVLADAGDNLTAINLIKALGDNVVKEEIVEGMEDGHGHDDKDDGAGHGSDADSGTPSDHDDSEYDEHLWLSLKNATVLCSVIADALADIDPDNASLYKANAAAYISELEALDAAYKAAVDEAAHKTILVCDRFPLRYLAEDYDLDYHAAFPGCSAETEASFETIVFLANKIDELSLPAVLIMDGSGKSLAETIIKSAKTSAGNISILTFNSMQNIDSKDIKNGITYLDVMKSNLEVLKKALT
ncbi:MAG: metal ABC transporter substrate-binding protein [Eubacteriales bacterium]|jgi:zinc transport system substrate-binding protein